MLFDSFTRPNLTYYVSSESLQLQSTETVVLYARRIIGHPITATFMLGVFATVSYLAGYYHSLHLVTSSPKERERKEECSFYPELPPLPLELSPNDPGVQAAARLLDTRLRELYQGGTIDSLSIGIVGANGLLFTRGYGFANTKMKESNDRREVDENTVYRVASLTKIFTALKLWMLKERGAIAWDDDIRKYCPEFSYISGSWELFLMKDPKCQSSLEPVTLRQIASHLAGIPRDLPPQELRNWPKNMEGTGLPHYFTKDVPLAGKQILDSVANYPLSNAPNFEPLYSNTGYALLGMVCKAAESLNACGCKSDSFPDMIQRDILRPLSMHSSCFEVTSDNRDRVAVASTDNGNMNVDLKAMNASYGILSSIADLAKLMQTFLAPNRHQSLIRPSTLREWLQLVYSWTDELTEVGLLWEIIKIRDTFGRRRRVYQKLGEFNGHYSAFAFNPSSAFGVIVLMTGSYQDTERVVLDAFENFQPVFDNLQVNAVEKEYAGTWRSSDGESEAIINVENGSLWVCKLDLKGNDILSILRDAKTEKMALASTGREREFRLAKGYRPETGWRHWGAMPYWVINTPGFSRGVPVDIVYFSESSTGLILNVPSAQVSLTRMIT